MLRLVGERSLHRRDGAGMWLAALAYATMRLLPYWEGATEPASMYSTCRCTTYEYGCAVGTTQGTRTSWYSVHTYL